MNWVLRPDRQSLRRLPCSANEENPDAEDKARLPS
jgi:hypothetical protein